MKKNRAAFFNESMDYYNTQMPNMGPNIAMAQSGYYMGPVPYMNNQMMDNEDLTSRVAKLERQVNRLEHRISTLEQNNTSYSNDSGESTINNMYMV